MALTDNIVAYYKMQDGTDATGGGNTLATSGTVNFNGGLIGNAADFGTTRMNANCLSKATSFSIDLSLAFSISLWAYLATDFTNNTTECLCAWWSTTGTAQSQSILAQQNATVNQIGLFQNAEGTVTCRFNYTFTNSTWTHIVVTQDASNNVIFYINNVSSGTGTQTTKSSLRTEFSVGNNNTTEDPLDIGWAGKVDEVGIWSRALTVSEISSLYNSGAGNQYPFTGAAAIKSLPLIGAGI